jgi:hypothetical protein
MSPNKGDLNFIKRLSPLDAAAPSLLQKGLRHLESNLE